VLLDAFLSCLFFLQVCLQPLHHRPLELTTDTVLTMVEMVSSLLCLVVSTGAVLSVFFKLGIPQWTLKLQVLAAILRLSYFLQLPARFRSCGQQLVLVDIGRGVDYTVGERGRLLSGVSLHYSGTGSPNTTPPSHPPPPLPRPKVEELDATPRWPSKPILTEPPWPESPAVASFASTRDAILSAAFAPGAAVDDCHADSNPFAPVANTTVEIHRGLYD